MTSVVSPAVFSTVVATTTSVSRKQIIFLKSSMTRLTLCAAWNISITTTAKTDEEAKALLAGFRFPFKN